MSDAQHNEKSALVPRLRFPEFRGEGEWEEKTLDAVCEMQAGKFVAASEIAATQADGLFPCFGGNGLRGYTKTFNQTGRYSLIGRQGALCGNVNLVDGDFYATEHAVVTTPKAGISTDWLFYNLCLLNLNRFATGQAQPGLSVEVLEKVACVVPNDKNEQQRIADCLSSLDELITAETQKLGALKTHKKGLMQQLFPHEGETEPVCRFSTEGDWTVASLPDVVFFQEGPGIMAVDFCSEGVPLVRLAGVAGPAVTLNGCNYLEPEKVAQKWAHFRLELDDLIISTSATFGLSSIVTEVASGAVFYTGLIRFRPSNERLSLGYLKTFLSSPCFARQAESAAVGGGIKHFGPTHLKQMEIPVPPLAEQQRISGCFTSLDDLITSQSQKIDALKTHKKGLMQQLFPVLNEVPA